jgi:hypothetical protein
VNKKNQKNFTPRDSAWGNGSATCNCQRKKRSLIPVPGVCLGLGKQHGPEEQKFFGSFF